MAKDAQKRRAHPFRSRRLNATRPRVWKQQHQTKDDPESCAAAKRSLLNMLHLRMLVAGLLEQLRLFLFEGAPRRMQLRDG